MEDLRRARHILAGAFILALGVITLLLFYPFENPWILLSAWGMACFTGTFAAAVIMIFLATYFPADRKDPWKSSYYRYMRNLWGESWGGLEHPYRISVCPAVRYTWLTLFFWFLFVGALGFLSYHAFVIGIGGFEASPLWDIGGKGNNVISDIAGITLIFGILGNIAMILVFRVLFSAQANFSSRVDVVFGALVSALAFLTIVVAPIQSFDAMAVGQVIFWVAAVVTGGASIVFLFYLFVTMLFKGIKGLRNTAPGQLFSELHETLCPEIVEKYPPKEA